MGGCNGKKTKEHLISSIRDTREEINRVIKDISELKKKVINGAAETESTFINAESLDESLLSLSKAGDYSGCVEEVRNSFQEAYQRGSESIKSFNSQKNPVITENSAHFSDFILRKSQFNKEGLFFMTKIAELDREMEEFEFKIKEGEMDKLHVQKDTEEQKNTINNLELELEVFRLNEETPIDAEYCDQTRLKEEKERIVKNINYMNENSYASLSQEIEKLTQEQKTLLQSIELTNGVLSL